jgi:putative nucleotide binding protein
MEEYAFILDILKQGRSGDHSYNRTPVVLSLGETEFKLLEMTPKDEVIITVGDRVYIGKDLQKRDKISTVKRRISYDELTSSAMSELPYVLESIIKSNEKKYVEFFNTSDSINSRMHTLELLQGLGNKTMWAILDERKKRHFESFQDLTDRVKTIHHPEKMIAARIVQEIDGKNEKYRIFVRQ